MNVSKKWSNYKAAKSALSMDPLRITNLLVQVSKTLRDSQFPTGALVPENIPANIELILDFARCLKWRILHKCFICFSIIIIFGNPIILDDLSDRTKNIGAISSHNMQEQNDEDLEYLKSLVMFEHKIKQVFIYYH